MRNIELKARTTDLEKAESVARRLAGDAPHATLRQVDTYFNTREGRLKLREETGHNAANNLIFYKRPDTAGPKRSEYDLIPIADPPVLRRALTTALGVAVVVEKQRTVYLWKNVRIHLDMVAGLGSFIEFEAVMPDGAPDEEGEGLVRFLMEEFAIAAVDLIQCSYSDMLFKTLDTEDGI